MELNKPTKEYNKDKHMVYSCQYHVIFCPKYRRPVLTGKIEERLKEIIYDKQEEYQYKLLDMQIMPDHVHLLLDVNPKFGIYRVVSLIKGHTSKTLRDEFPELKRKLPTLWTLSRFVSTVGAVSLETVIKYIEEQKGK